MTGWFIASCLYCTGMAFVFMSATENKELDFDDVVAHLTVAALMVFWPLVVVGVAIHWFSSKRGAQ
jgi:hypothetical protein